MNLKPSRVLVTGANGFIGSHLVERLVSEGCEVRAFCHYNAFGSYGWLDQVDPEVMSKVKVILGDIRDARQIEEACRNVDVVFHLAALISIPFSYEAPHSFVETNVLGTLNVLEAVKRNGVRRLVQTSTSEVYGTPKEVPIVETHPLQGQSPYSATKIAADKLCESFHCSFQLPVVTLRPFNTYGPRQSTRAVLPTILVQLLSGKKEVELGNLTPKRDLTYVSDTVDGFVKAGFTPGIEGETIQLGTLRAVSIKELFETTCRVLNLEATIRHDSERERPDSSEVMVLLSDPAKAGCVMGWSPKVSLEEGLLRTAEWLKPNLSLYHQGRFYR